MAYWDGRTFAAAEGMALAEPIPAQAGAVAAVKAYLRIETSDEDALIARLVGTAIGHGETFTGRTLIARGVTERMTIDGGWRRLARAPVTTITAVEGLPASGDPVALAAGSYAIDIDAARDGWVRVSGGSGRARVTFTAGLASDWSGLPEPIAQGVVRLAAHLFTHRDARDEGAPPAAIAALWRPWRRMRLA